MLLLPGIQALERLEVLGARVQDLHDGLVETQVETGPQCMIQEVERSGERQHGHDEYRQKKQHLDASVVHRACSSRSSSTLKGFEEPASFQAAAIEAPAAYCWNILLKSARESEAGAGADSPGRTVVGSGSAAPLFSATHLRISSIRSFSTGLKSNSAVRASSALGAVWLGNKPGSLRLPSAATTSSIWRYVCESTITSSTRVSMLNVSSHRSYLTAMSTSFRVSGLPSCERATRIRILLVSPLARSLRSVGGNRTCATITPR